MGSICFLPINKFTPVHTSIVPTPTCLKTWGGFETVVWTC